MKQFRQMRTIAVLAVLLVISGLHGQTEMRQWTGSNGKEIQAEFVSRTQEAIIIKMKNGETMTVPKSEFSQEDRDWVESLVPFSGIVCSSHDEINNRFSEVARKKMQVLRVDDVIPGSPAEKAGIEKGAFFSKAGNRPFKDADAYEKWLTESGSGPYVYRFHRISQQPVRKRPGTLEAFANLPDEVVQETTVKIPHQWLTKTADRFVL